MYMEIINTFIIKFSLELCESRIGQRVDVVILIDRKIDEQRSMLKLTNDPQYNKFIIFNIFLFKQHFKRFIFQFH